jgi:hypothetical protein
MRHRTIGVGLLSVSGLLLSPSLQAATCNAQARYVKATALDAKGFKQGVTLAVSASTAGHGLVSYTISFKDKDGGSQTKTANVQYKFSPSAASASGGSGGTKVTDDTVLGAGACTAAKPCSVLGATVGEVSCFKDGGGKCSTTASYVDSTSTDPKGFKQGVNFNLSSADCGAACHGLVKYALKWKDKDGVEKTDQKNVSYKMSAGGSAGEIEVTDETVLGATMCSDKSPCTVTGATVDKVSCFAEK